MGPEDFLKLLGHEGVQRFLVPAACVFLPKLSADGRQILLQRLVDLVPKFLIRNLEDSRHLPVIEIHDEVAYEDNAVSDFPTPVPEIFLVPASTSLTGL